MNLSEAIIAKIVQKYATKTGIQKVMFELRKQIVEIKNSPLPENFQVEDIYKGECEFTIVP